VLVGFDFDDTRYVVLYVLIDWMEDEIEELLNLLKVIENCWRFDEG
jgi:hypothetical protein